MTMSVSSVQLLSGVWLFATPWTAARQASLSITNSWSLLKLMSIELVMPSNHLILCCALLLLPSIIPSIRVFSNESVPCIGWPKYWSFSFSISPSNEYSGLISFRMDWLDLLAVQGTLKSLLQHHSSKASIPWQFRDVYFTYKENMIWKANQPSQDYTLLAACTKTKVIWSPVYLSIISTVWLLTVKKWLETLRLLCRIKCIWGASGFVGFTDASFLQISSLFQFNQDQGDDMYKSK